MTISFTPPEVLAALQDGVGTITLNRPDQLNAITPQMDALLRRAYLELEADADCRVIVIRGAGRGFCAGADLGPAAAAASAMAARGPENGKTSADAAWEASPKQLEQFRFGYLLTSAKPSIAAINGAAIGVGLLLAMCCDIRLAALDAKLAFPYTRLGLVAEYGIAKILPQLIGAAHAADLLLTGRVIVGEQAERIGLVSRAVASGEWEATLADYAEGLAKKCSARSIAAIKRQLSAAPGQTLLGAIQLADEELQAARLSPDYAEARAARREKRPPNFNRSIL